MLFVTRTPAPAPAVRVEIYRGCAAGWQAVGSARPVAQAEALARLAARIRPDGHYRVAAA